MFLVTSCEHFNELSHDHEPVNTQQVLEKKKLEQQLEQQKIKEEISELKKKIAGLEKEIENSPGVRTKSKKYHQRLRRILNRTKFPLSPADLEKNIKKLQDLKNFTAKEDIEGKIKQAEINKKKKITFKDFRTNSLITEKVLDMKIFLKMLKWDELFVELKKKEQELAGISSKNKQ